MLEHNGKYYARVSDVLRPFTDFGHIDAHVLERKARIGTSAHEAIADEIAGNFPTPMREAEGYFDSFLEWCYKAQPDFVSSEERLFCDEKMITGQLDALIRSPDYHLPILIDFKTSVQESPTWVMQAHLYAYLVEKTRGIEPIYWFIKLDKKGKFPKVFEYKWNPEMEFKCMAAIDDFWKSENACCSNLSSVII